MHSHGTHLIADFWGCRMPAGEAAWRRLLTEAVAAMDVTLLHLHVHRFEPDGATAIALLAESHLAIHSWPEDDYLAIDIFTCGPAARADAGIRLLAAMLEPTRQNVRCLARGGSGGDPAAASGMTAASVREQPCL